MMTQENRNKMCNSMVQQNIVVQKIIGLVVLSLGLTFQALGHIDVAATTIEGKFGNRVSKNEASERLQQLNSIIDITITDEVQERIQQYTYHYRSSAENILGKVMIYFPVFEKEIMRRGLPDDLKYLAVVESMLNPKATSKSGAAGLWQFMKGTGKMVGLEINSEIDQRRSIELSTQAALDYLQSLYDRFGDWNLAIAAYNCGPGNLSKALKKSKSKDFWEIRKYLPKETQKYLPRFIAAMYLTNYFQYHELVPRSFSNDLLHAVSVPVKETIWLNKLEKELFLDDTNILKDLNPEYTKGYVPGGSGQYSIRIPSRLLERFYELYEPGLYSKIIEEREEKKRLAKLEEQKLELELQEQLDNTSRDTVSALEEIVSLIFTSIQSKSSKLKYRIPSKMRSRELYARI